MRYRLLDLCCGAGGAASGYRRAYFDVVGVDINPQPHYPGTFVQADALTYPLDGFDAVHASPPCQRWSVATSMHPGLFESYPDLITPLRERFIAAGIPYVIENVPGAPLVDPVLMCGSMFRLRAFGGWLRRHRYFECSFPVFPLQCSHPIHLDCIGVYGGGGAAGRHRMGTMAEKREAMQIDWMNRDEINQAIPPAYTEYIGHQLREHLERRATHNHQPHQDARILRP